MKIIYQTTDGIAVITPAPNCSLTDAQTAAKDVPTGSAYKIVADDYVPSDRTFRNAWTIESSELTDGVGD
jgi:hypothetical protein